MLAILIATLYLIYSSEGIVVSGYNIELYK